MAVPALTVPDPPPAPPDTQELLIAKQPVKILRPFDAVEVAVGTRFMYEELDWRERREPGEEVPMPMRLFNVSNERSGVAVVEVANEKALIAPATMVEVEDDA